MAKYTSGLKALRGRGKSLSLAFITGIGIFALPAMASADAIKKLPYIPDKFASYVNAWETGTWKLQQPGCFSAYFFCHKSQEEYNATSNRSFPHS